MQASVSSVSVFFDTAASKRMMEDIEYVSKGQAFLVPLNLSDPVWQRSII